MPGRLTTSLLLICRLDVLYLTFLIGVPVGFGGPSSPKWRGPRDVVHSNTDTTAYSRRTKLVTQFIRTPIRRLTVAEQNYIWTQFIRTPTRRHTVAEQIYKDTVHSKTNTTRYSRRTKLVTQFTQTS